MKIKSIQTIGKASYNLCSMVLATAAVSAVSIFGTVGQAQAQVNNSSNTDTASDVTFRLVTNKEAEPQEITFGDFDLTLIPLTEEPVTPDTPSDNPVGRTEGQLGNHVETPEPSLILGFIAVGGLMLGNTRKAKD